MKNKLLNHCLKYKRRREIKHLINSQIDEIFRLDDLKRNNYNEDDSIDKFMIKQNNRQAKEMFLNYIVEILTDYIENA